jgi:hypothetical protein
MISKLESLREEDKNELDITSEEPKRIDFTDIKVNYCPKHKEEKYEYFCMDDNMKLCHICAKFEHRNHYELISILDAAKISKEKMKEINYTKLTKEIEKKIKNIDQQVIKETREFEEKLRKLKELKENEIKQIEQVEVISQSIEKEEGLDQLIDWSVYLQENSLIDRLHISLNQVLGCGCNEYGNIGFEDKEDRVKFELMDIHDKNIQHLSSGNFHTFVLCDNKLYGAGSNQSGQLGIGNFEHQFKFVEVKFFTGMDILEVVCGGYHTFVHCSNL